MTLGLRLPILLLLLHLSQAIKIYFNAEYDGPESRSLEDASAVLSRHLGLDLFESSATSHHDSQTTFVGRGKSNALLLTMYDADADLLPMELFPSSLHSQHTEINADSILSVTQTFVYRAKNVYASVVESWNVGHLYSFFEHPSMSRFATLDLSALFELGQIRGKDSEEYRNALQHVRSFLEAHHEKLQIAILTYSLSNSQANIKRQDDPQHPLPSIRPPPQEPLGSVSTCFTSVDSCNNATSACSGRGQCMQATKAGRTCFVCTCSVTKSGQGNSVKTEKWVGESCERLDVSGPFVLITGTVVALILIVIGSVSLLYSVGNIELPSTLMGNAVIRKD